MHSATGSFYFQAFNGSVTLPVAGYDYNSDWTPLLAGLSPAGMAASLAARSWRDELAVSKTGPQHLSERNSLAPSKASGQVESRMGAVAWAMRQRSVSHPRSSNRT
jgi:hypothetical protein